MTHKGENYSVKLQKYYFCNGTTKRVYLVKEHITNAQLQYDETWGTGLSIAKINYYGNQSSS